MPKPTPLADFSLYDNGLLIYKGEVLEYASIDDVPEAHKYIVYEYKGKCYLKHGEGGSYFDNGKYRYNGDYEFGLRHGYGTAYDRQGNIEYAGHYDRGYKHGRGVFYYPEDRERTSRPKLIGTFDCDRLVYGTEYYLSGYPSYCGHYVDGKKVKTGTKYTEPDQDGVQRMKTGSSILIPTQRYPSSCVPAAYVNAGISPEYQSNVIYTV